ncbi:MAG: class I SAM-dependent methyltransferase [Planctomycetaceae bacterium]
MTNTPDPRETFTEMYAGDPPPWDIGRPQTAFVRAADRIAGRVLDAGCGTGENALFFAGRGCEVTGIDFLDGPIAAAREKAAGRGLDVRFLTHDATRLATLAEQFDAVIDCGLFHVFSDDDRAAYIAGLGAITRPGGTLFLQCFSDKEPAGEGPRRISESELRAAFASGWRIESVRETRFDIRPETDLGFSEGGPFAWFAVIRRKPS